MPIQTCPSCLKKLQISDKHIGKRVRCPMPNCGFIFPVTASTPPPTPSVAEPVNGSPVPSDTCIFISHAVTDQHFVDSAVHQFFKRQNIATWHCAHDIRAGANYQQQIMDGLNKSDWFVVVLSRQSIKSDPVRQEVDLAFRTKERGRILPILMEALQPSQIKELHPELPDIQYEDFTKNVEQSQRRLLVSIIRQLTKECNESEQTKGHQSQTIEDLKTSNADLATQKRELEGRVLRAANFDGQWSEGGGGGIVPVFCPMKTRGVPIVAVCNLKGGVGKTTLTANLGATLWGDPFRKRVLLMDLDYQGSLSTICLDGRVRSRLTQQQRFVQEVFKPTTPDGKLILNLAHEVTDERTRNHQASIIAADEDLARAEGEVLGRWMMRDKDGVDGRYLLRQVLHTNVVPKNYDIVLIDCPPRMTAAGINAFLAADFVLIPTPLEEVSIEAVPRLLRWVRERRQQLLSNLAVLGVVVSRTRRSELVEYEKELLDRLKHECEDAWGSAVKIYDTCIPLFPAASVGYRYPAQHPNLRVLFSDLVKEMMPKLALRSALAVKAPTPVLAKK